jgi:hypothetical protein
LLVRPEPFPDGEIVRNYQQGSSDFAIEISLRDGETSGRFDVTTLIARVFPRFRSFAKEVREADSDLNLKFPSGPFMAAAGRKGLGAEFSMLRPSAAPISGVAMLVGEDLQNVSSALVIFTRLPAALRHPAPVIMAEAERESRRKQE